MSERYPAEPDTFPKSKGKGNGSFPGYSVEARLVDHSPRTIAGNLLDTRWRELSFEHPSSGQGVISPLSLHSPGIYGLLEYQAAQALRWWFLANAELEFSCGLCETRLVKHMVKYEYSKEAVSAHAFVGSDDRANIRPLD